ncbi:MAG: DUF2530 domain-containing protein [Jiangellaceae bacterium]
MRSRRDGKRDAPAVEPVDVDGVRTLAIVTVLWAVAFVALASQRAALNEAGRGWWLWTCLAGVGLGLLGLEYCRKRRDAIAHEELREEADADPQEDWPDPEQAEGAAVAEPMHSDGLAADPQVTPHPAAPPPERPVHAEPADQFGYGAGEEDQPMHHPDDQHQHRDGRPPPGYVTTGDLPIVPPQQPAAEPPPESVPQQWNEQPWPPPEPEGSQAPPGPPVPPVPQHTQPEHPYPPATSAGYSPEPDLARRHPRDIEMARRREAEAGHSGADAPGSTPRPAAPPEFLQEEPEPAAASQPPWEPEPRAAEPPAGLPAGPPAGPDPVLESEFFSDIPAGGASSGPAEQSADDDPDVLLGDVPQAPERGQRDAGQDSSGEYRGRRARRD